MQKLTVILYIFVHYLFDCAKGNCFSFTLWLRKFNIYFGLVVAQNTSYIHLLFGQNITVKYIHLLVAQRITATLYLVVAQSLIVILYFKASQRTTAILSCGCTKDNCYIYIVAPQG